MKKSELLQQIAMHFKLSFTVSSKKDEINCLVTQRLVEEKLAPEPENETEEPKSLVVDSSVVELKHLEFEDHERQ